jgi:hypothetical protein
MAVHRGNLSVSGLSRTTNGCGNKKHAFNAERNDLHKHIYELEKGLLLNGTPQL